MTNLYQCKIIRGFFYCPQQMPHALFSKTPKSFQIAMEQLQNTISIVSTWMSSNLLCLNQSKSEFMVIGLPAQLAKLQKPSLLMPANTTLIPVTSARNLGFKLDATLSLSDQISSITQTCFFHIRDLRRVRKSLDYNLTTTQLDL
jgi:hypothetical protein